MCVFVCEWSVLGGMFIHELLILYIKRLIVKIDRILLLYSIRSVGVISWNLFCNIRSIFFSRDSEVSIITVPVFFIFSFFFSKLKQFSTKVGGCSFLNQSCY